MDQRIFIFLKRFVTTGIKCTGLRILATINKDQSITENINMEDVLRPWGQGTWRIKAQRQAFLYSSELYIVSCFRTCKNHIWPWHNKFWRNTITFDPAAIMFNLPKSSFPYDMHCLLAWRYFPIVTFVWLVSLISPARNISSTTVYTCDESWVSYSSDHVVTL